MFKRIIALVICAVMMAGCASSTPAAPSSSQAEPEADQPVYTYKDHAPDMVMVTAPGGDITYKDYRLYIDTSESIARHNARQNAAVVGVLEHDLKKKGIEIDEQEFEAQAEANIQTMRNYYPDFDTELNQLAEIAGLTVDQTLMAIKFGFRSDFLIEKMGAAIEAEAAEEYAPLAIEPSETVDPELIKQQGIYDLASRKMEAYSKEMNSRLSFEKDGILVTLDGEDLPLTDEAAAFISYSAAASRLDTISFIHQGELMLRALEKKGIELDIEAINASHDEYIESIKASPEQMERLMQLCAPLGATADDYFEGLRRPIIIETATTRYYQMVDEEYAKLVEENTNDKGEQIKELPSPDQYYVEGMAALLEGSELVNISGK